MKVVPAHASRIQEEYLLYFQRIENSCADLVVNFYEVITGMAYLFLPPPINSYDESL